MDDPQPITVAAMILCDGVARDDFEGKTTVVGCSSGFVVPELPTVLPPFAAFIMFAEVTRRTRLDLQIVTNDHDIIYELPPSFVESSDPLSKFEFDPRFVGVNVNAAGDYFLRLLADSVYIMELRFYVQVENREDS